MGTSTEGQTSQRRDLIEDDTRTTSVTERWTSDEQHLQCNRCSTYKGHHQGWANGRVSAPGTELRDTFSSCTGNSCTEEGERCDDEGASVYSDRPMLLVSSGSTNSQIITEAACKHQSQQPSDAGKSAQSESFVEPRETSPTSNTANFGCSFASQDAVEEGVQSSPRPDRQNEKTPTSPGTQDETQRMEHGHTSPPWPSTPPSTDSSPSRPSITSMALRALDAISVFLGSILTILIVESRRRSGNHSLPFLQHLPPRLTDSLPLLFGLWSLIGLSHILRSPKYWPESGLVAGAVSLGTGAWFGPDVMIDTLIVTAYLSLLVAKMVDDVRGTRPRTLGVPVLPVYGQDCKGEKEGPGSTQRG
ncbi:hypothetical protein QBC39DRAFT_348314 [Podospora conica]|nr:hypothetical protein QBC39DRAFT_348314 [Schizothecium conicum]